MTTPQKTSKNHADIAKMSFEAALSEVETIAQNMDEGNLLLEDSIAAYERAAHLIAHCKAKLSQAEEKIRVLENGELKELDLPARGQA